MENKSTTELFDLSSKLSEEKGDWAMGGKIRTNHGRIKSPGCKLLSWEALKGSREPVFCGFSDLCLIIQYIWVSYLLRGTLTGTNTYGRCGGGRKLLI
jgi:hypothetical protein